MIPTTAPLVNETDLLLNETDKGESGQSGTGSQGEGSGQVMTGEVLQTQSENSVATEDLKISALEDTANEWRGVHKAVKHHHPMAAKPFVQAEHDAHQNVLHQQVKSAEAAEAILIDAEEFVAQDRLSLPVKEKPAVVKTIAPVEQKEFLFSTEQKPVVVQAIVPAEQDQPVMRAKEEPVIVLPVAPSVSKEVADVHKNDDVIILPHAVAPQVTVTFSAPETVKPEPKIFSMTTVVNLPLQLAVIPPRVVENFAVESVAPSIVDTAPESKAVISDVMVAVETVEAPQVITEAPQVVAQTPVAENEISFETPADTAPVAVEEEKVFVAVMPEPVAAMTIPAVEKSFVETISAAAQSWPENVDTILTVEKPKLSVAWLKPQDDVAAEPAVFEPKLTAPVSQEQQSTGMRRIHRNGEGVSVVSPVVPRLLQESFYDNYSIMGAEQNLICTQGIAPVIIAPSPVEIYQLQQRPSAQLKFVA